VSRCLGCYKPGIWFCESCESDRKRLYREVRDMSRYLGESEGEGHLVITASQILEAYEKVENSTSLGKASINARARELLLEVTDHFMHTPVCPMCKEHKMELKTGDPMVVGCTGGCEF
jgi:ribosomal protein L37AE/L43A